MLSVEHHVPQIHDQHTQYQCDCKVREPITDCYEIACMWHGLIFQASGGGKQ